MRLGSYYTFDLHRVRADRYGRVLLIKLDIWEKITALVGQPPSIQAVTVICGSPLEEKIKFLLTEPKK